MSGGAGTLHGVGVGPGDPELMTLRAHRLIRAARVIAYPAPETDGVVGASFARAIAAEAIPEHAEEIPIAVPMRAERYPAQEIYAVAAERLAAHLAEGRDVVALCEGDPFFYGSFMYLYARLADRFRVEVTPGVSALTACAAAAGRPLAARSEPLRVLPGPASDAVLGAALAAPGALAMIKVGRHLPRLRRLVAEAGRLERAVYVARASLAEEAVLPLAAAPEAAPYFSMILISGDDPYAMR